MIIPKYCSSPYPAISVKWLLSCTFHVYFHLMICSLHKPHIVNETRLWNWRFLNDKKIRFNVMICKNVISLSSQSPSRSGDTLVYWENPMPPTGASTTRGVRTVHRPPPPCHTRADSRPSTWTTPRSTWTTAWCLLASASPASTPLSPCHCPTTAIAVSYL